MLLMLCVYENYTSGNFNAFAINFLHVKLDQISVTLVVSGDDITLREHFQCPLLKPTKIKAYILQIFSFHK